MRKLALVAGALVLAGGAIFAMRSRAETARSLPTTPASAVAPARPTAHVSSARPAYPQRTEMARSQARLPDETSYAESERHRWIAAWDRWVIESKLTADQEQQALQLVADATAIYASTAEARSEMFASQFAMERRRMTPEQRELIDAPGDDAHARARPVYEAIDATRPPDEKRAADDAMNAERGRDLLADVEAQMAQFLDERQLARFHEEIAPDWDSLLLARIARVQP